LYVAKHQDQAERWLKDKPPKPSTIRKSLGDKAKLDESYRVLGKFAHPGLAALVTTIDREPGILTLRLSGTYDERHFTVALYMLFGSAVNLLAIPLMYLHEKQPELLARATSTRDAVIKWIQRANAETA